MSMRYLKFVAGTIASETTRRRVRMNSPLSHGLSKSQRTLFLSWSMDGISKRYWCLSMSHSVLISLSCCFVHIVFTSWFLRDSKAWKATSSKGRAEAKTLPRKCSLSNMRFEVSLSIKLANVIPYLQIHTSKRIRGTHHRKILIN